MPTVDNWFVDLTASQRVPLESLRSMILGAHAEIVEEFKWGQPCYSCNRLFCYLKKAKAHVTIGFQHGAALADPEKILEGTGKDMRHVKIALDGGFDKKAINALIREALRYDATVA